MSPAPLPLSPLSLNQLTRDYWGRFDPIVIAQLASLAQETCYEPKFYKSPAAQDELMAAGQYVEHGLKMTPGSLWYGTLLPASPLTLAPPLFQCSIRDEAIQHDFFDEPIPSQFLANFNPVYLDPNSATCGSSANLLDCCHPITGSGLFTVRFWNDPSTAQRVQLIFCCLEAMK